MKNSNINDKYFCLHANCILVKGHNRSSIIDTQWRNIHFIPNSLFYILKQSRNKTIGWIKSHYNNNPILDDYFNFLIVEELGMYVDNPKLFPPIKLEYENPSIITNAIIEYSNASDYDIENIFFQLSELNCESVEIRFISNVNVLKLRSLLKGSHNTSFRSMVLGIPFDESYSVEALMELLEQYLKIDRVHVYKSNNSQIVRSEYNQPLIIYSKQDNIFSSNCGNISPDYFSVCLEIVCESALYNTCLHRKVCIAADGSIKNCLSMNKSYGNIKHNTLNDIVKLESFQFFWNIKKDDVKVCKGCEMRYVCHDCRAYITDTSDVYSKPQKCTYNPYISKWG